MGKVLFLKKGGTHTAPKRLLNNCTWAEIRALSDAGNAANYFALGDTKTIVINGTVGMEAISNLSIDAFILGFNHNSSVEGANRIHFSIGKIGGVDVALCGSKYDTSCNGASGYFSMNTNTSNKNGWNGSHMRKTVLGSDKAPTSPAANTLLAALPSDLRAVMKSITKYTDNTGNSNKNNASCVTATTDYLPLLAEFELFGSRYVANTAEQNYQKQYDYYAAGNSKVRYKHNAAGTAAERWLRSPNPGDSTTFTDVGTTGELGFGLVRTCLGISPIFAV
jgi:hypothetical protein